MEIVPLPQGFGARIEGFDLAEGRDPADVDRLRRAYAEHDLLIFHGAGPVAPARQAEIAEWFGPIGANRGPDGNPWTELDNTHVTGSAVLPFHSDASYLAQPTEGICLHPVALPAGGTSTSFVSNAVAWDALPQELKDRIGGRRARHYCVEGGQMNPDLPAIEYWHPATMPHPRTGRPLLYVTEHHCVEIEGLSEAEGTEVLAALCAVLYAPERRYDHRWRLGDLLVWDNRAIQHARTQAAEPERGSRIMRRVALGSLNIHEQFEQAWQNAAA